jgi:hypothetical protein
MPHKLLWREPCSKGRIKGRYTMNLCSSGILFDKSYQVSSSQMRFAQQIRNSRGGTTSLIPVVKQIVAAPTNKF